MVGTSVLPNAIDIDAHLPRTTSMARMQANAFANKGACTKVFKQGGLPQERKGKTQMAQLGLGKYYLLRQKPNGAPMAGVCKALSVYWIGFHANDEDFWGWLSNRGFMRVNTASQIIEAHLDSYAQGQEAWEVNTLKAVGVIKQCADVVDDMGGISALGRAHLLGQWIAPDNGRWGYKSISIRGAVGGHAVSAWVGKDVCYFDSNYGEFWFESRKDFRSWFYNYWADSYANVFNGEFIVRSFGKSVASVRGRNNWM